MKTHTSSFKEQIKLIGKEIDSRITFGSTVLGKNDLNAVTPSYQGAILKSVMKQLDIDSNVAIPIGTNLKYEFGLKVNGEYEYINYGNYVVYSIEKQEDTNSYKIVCYDKLLYSMLNYAKLPITYPISVRDYINAVSTALGLTFANNNDTFANYDKQIQADLYDGLGYTFRDVLDELAQVTASTICLNENDELEIRYITETNDTIDEEFLKDVNVNFGEKFGKVNTIVLSRSGDSDSVYYPSVLPANPYEIKISDNQIMNGNDRADFLPDIYNKLNGLEFYTNDFVSTGIVYYNLCDRYSVKVGDNTYSCVMFNDEVLVTQGLEENVYTELPEQTETDYKHASKDDRMINQVYIIAKKNEAEILALVSTTETIQKEINPTKDESGSNIIVEDASNNPLTYLEIEGKSTQDTRSGKNIINIMSLKPRSATQGGTITFEGDKAHISSANQRWAAVTHEPVSVKTSTDYHFHYVISNFVAGSDTPFTGYEVHGFKADGTQLNILGVQNINSNRTIDVDFNTQDYEKIRVWLISNNTATNITNTFTISELIVCEKDLYDGYEQFGVSPSPDYPSEIESVGYDNLFNNIASSDTINGLTFTINEDKSITINGIATADTVFKFTNSITLPVGTYTLSGCPDGGSWETYRITSYNGQYYDFGSNKTFTITENLTQEWYIQIYSGATLNNITFYPMLEKGTIAHPFVPNGKYGIEVKTIGENLLENIKPAGTTTANGLNFVVNNDKSILVNGTSTQQTTFSITPYLYNDYAGKYLKGAPSGSSSSSYCLFISYYDKNYQWKTEEYDKGNGLLIKDIYPIIEISILIRKDTTVNNQIFKPMIVDNIDTEYKPYQKNTSVIVLNEPLRSLPNEVKDLAYIKNNKLYVDRYVGSVILDGTQEIIYSEPENGRYDYTIPNAKANGLCLSNHFIYEFAVKDGKIFLSAAVNNRVGLTISSIKSNNDMNIWLSTHNTQVDYELATPVTEEYDEIEMLKTLKGYNNISTTDKLLPIINLTYVRDTVIADYVENHVTELKLTENEIKASVKSVSSSVDGLNTTINRVEEITNDNSQVINVISTNIDRSSGEVREVTTTTGFTFNADGMTIDDGSGFKAQHRSDGTYYKDGDSIVGQYTKDGSKQKDLELFGTYSYGKESIDDTPMFVGQLYTDSNGERGFGHFYNGEG